MDYSAELAHVLGEDGPFAEKISDFQFRPQQLAMAQALAASIVARQPFLAEAGTGTGKTFAYLVPALLYGGKVLISTGTKTLQDQLFERDLPLVRRILGLSVQLALLKGRANYICWHRLERSEQELAWFSDEEATQLQIIRRFANRTATGDRNDLAEIAENAVIWPQVTSTKDNCLGADCSFYRDCFLMKARKAALEADVVVVNHHLLFADLILREEGFAELLPTCHTVVCDEAHQLPELASLFFGEMVSSGALNELAREVEAVALAKLQDFPALREACTQLMQAVRGFRELLLEKLGHEGKKNKETAGEITLAQLVKDTHLAAGFPKLLAAVEALNTALTSQKERVSELEPLAKRLDNLQAHLRRWWQGQQQENGLPVAKEIKEPKESKEAEPVPDAGQEKGEGKDRDSTSLTDWVRWLEYGPHHFTIQATPLETGPIFQRCLAEHPAAWIFTSATLSVNQDFQHFQAALGLHETAKGVWDSPFQYGEQAVLYLPKHLPEPRAPEHTEALLQAALPVLAASKGRAFLLFTTLKALDFARQRLPELLRGAGLSFPILAQGEQPRTELLRQFRQQEHPILLGSQTFWEGIDVKGPQLSLVLIDKLPFRAPDSPIVAARVRHLNAQGKQAFQEYQLPEAIITLKQGVGRLIRSEQDRGVLMIGDTRLVEKPYGRQFIANLPPMARTRDLAAVENFLASTS